MHREMEQDKFVYLQEFYDRVRELVLRAPELPESVPDLSRPKGGMRTHELKTDPDKWLEVKRGTKRFEIREDDRGFSVGDILHLRRTAYSHNEMKTSNKPLLYTADPPIKCRVDYIVWWPTGPTEKTACMSITVLPAAMP